MLGRGSTTLVEGSLFCVSTETGDFPEHGAFGLFFHDLRCLSRWELRVNGTPPEHLVTFTRTARETTHVCRVPPPRGSADSTLLVLRHRSVAAGLQEELVIRNLGQEPAACSVALLVEADFADLFEVKENRVERHPERISSQVSTSPPGVLFDYRWLGQRRSCQVTSEQLTAMATGLMTATVAIAPGEAWHAWTRAHLSRDDRPASRPGGAAAPDVERRPPRPVSSPWDAVCSATEQGLADLDALRLDDPEDPTCRTVAAGAPWFMTVFGRDSLLTSWMALPFDPELARGTLQVLAREQGQRSDPLTEEQPGRILHEMRFGAQATSALDGRSNYYGTVDATPLFVMLLEEAWQWGLPWDDVAALLPAADAALDWVETYGDSDGDGFVDYQRATDSGLRNQGWKDSFDGITDASGRLAAPPIALCEVQGYVYAAYRGRARLSRYEGDVAAAERHDARASDLKKRFNERFWLRERGYYALGLERDGRVVDALGSNAGHCLWTGIVDDDKAPSLIGHLTSPAMSTGWGVRTLASTMAAYNPMSYHNGSVWPHDSAIVAAGLARYGARDQSAEIAQGLLDASSTSGWRLTELWSGFDRDEFPAPVPYPTSCSPQAWAAAAPLLLLRSLLGLEVSVPQRTVSVRPVLPPGALPMTVSGLRIGDARCTVHVGPDGTAAVQGLPPGFTLRCEP